MGRFINADALVSTGQGLLGNNMFAYCGNNPVNLLDSGGALCQAIFGDNHLFSPDMLADFGGSGSSYAPESVSTRGRSITLKEFLDTGDPGVVFAQLETYRISYYKGALVVETPYDTSFSFGFIGLSTLQHNADTLKHEYEHTVQLKNLGICGYITDVAVPSVTINILDRLGNLPYNYLTYPWEAEANALGGSTLSDRSLPPLPQNGYTSYWDLILLFFK